MTIDYIKNNNLLLFECISGSNAYGLNTPESDTDIRGVFYLPKDKFYGLHYVQQVEDEKKDVVYYELGRFVELLLKNNPNMLELLATPEDCVLYRDPIMDNLTVDMFLSKLCKNTFAGYAISQIQKARGLNKKILNPMSKERKSILDFCYVLHDYGGSIPLEKWLSLRGFKQEDCGLANINHIKDFFDLYHWNMGTFRGIMSCPNANEVALSSIPKGMTPQNRLYFNRNGYSTYCKEYKEYWEWVEKRSEVRFNNTLSHGKRYDAKNMMHTIRLLQQSEEILSNGNLIVRVPNRVELLAIRRGEAEYDDLVNRAKEMIERIDGLYNTSTLQETPHVEFIENVLIHMRETLYEC